MISYEDFQKLEIRIGKVVSCEKVENADKLLKLEVDFGSAEQNSELKENKESSNGTDRTIRQVVSGIAEYYKPEDLIGKEFPFLFNLEPRTIRGLESQGMILAVDNGSQIALLSPDKEVEPGSKVK